MQTKSLVIVARVALVLLVGSSMATLASSSPIDAPTYSEHVAPILNDHCVSCHRPGQVAPMSLRSYDEVRPWAKSVARNVEERRMPPWHATGGTATFANDRSLEPDEIDTIVRWARSGAPPGDLEQAPEPPTFPTNEWKLGEPDFVATLGEVEVPAGGPDQFHNLPGTVQLKEDKWITAIEVLPGNPKVVHHVIVYKLKGFDFDPQEGWLGAWAAGTEPMVFPEGTGRLLKKGSNILGDMHYHPAETTEKDVTRIGLHFADDPSTIKKELTNTWVINENFKIPAGAKNHEVRAHYKFWQAGKILTLAPHMHYRGKDFRYVATWPDGRQDTLLEVADWDFNWQTFYVLDKPIPVPAGTTVECIAHYDNSADNPDNPDPTIDVTFGDESYDEMMIGFIDFVPDEGMRPLSLPELRTTMIDKLATEHPDAVYKVSAKEPEKRSEPDSYAPFYLPKEGDGTFYVIWNRQLDDARVYDIVWDGSSFTAKLASPWGPFDLDGEVSADGTLTTTMHLPQREMTWDGKRVEL